MVIGILIALQINNWNNNKLEKAKEIEILEGLHKTLTNDIVMFNSKLQQINLAEAKIQTLQDVLTSNERVD